MKLKGLKSPSTVNPEFRDFVQIGHDRRVAACKSFLETGTFKTAGHIPVTIADIEEASKRKQVQIPLLMKFIKDRMSVEKEAGYLVSLSAFNCPSDSPAKLKNELREKKRAFLINLKNSFSIEDFEEYITSV